MQVEKYLTDNLIKKTSLLIISTCISLAVTAKETLPAGFKEQKQKTISFIENKGQFADQNYHPRPDVLFGGSDGQITFHITVRGISYQLYRVDKHKQAEDPNTATLFPIAIGMEEKEQRKKNEKQTVYRTDIKWVNANPSPVVKTGEVLPGVTNYYLEQCPGGVLNVKSYAGITLQNIYNNINLHYYEKNGQLKHDYIVAPHADYKQIQLKVEGAEVFLQKDGSLLIETPLGKIQEQAPLVYQNGKRLSAQYSIKNNIISYEVENYNPDEELIIDPVTRLWGTYYGGTGGDVGKSCTSDGQGDVYQTGFTNSNTGMMIATTGSHQNTLGGIDDAYLAKFNNSGVRQWSTYYGGAGDDYGESCMSDASGNIYMAGQTASNAGTVIVTAGSHQSIHGGGSNDAFLVKFNSSGVRQWGTYYGGTGSDYSHSCAADASGNVYLSGGTASNTGTVIATAGSHQTAHGGAVMDAFLVKFNSGGVRQWGTYYGGAGNDYSNSCSTDASGNIYLSGCAASNGGTAIATAGAHQTAYGGGTYDTFLAKFNSNGVRQWGTYYGGTGADFGWSCPTDASGNVYLTGYTNSSTGTVIATPGSHQSAYGGGSWDDAFLVKFNSSGVRQWGTYYGGTLTDRGYSCATDAAGNVYLAGYAGSNAGTEIATPGSHQSACGGSYDSFLAKFNGAGVRQWGTYYGGTQPDWGNSCATDATGSVYLTGYAASNTGTVIATTGSHQNVHGGVAMYDAFLVRFVDCNVLSPPSAISGAASVCSGSSQTYSVAGDPFAAYYTWSLPPGWNGSSSASAILATVAASGILTVTANDACSSSSQQTLAVIANPLPAISVNTSDLLICVGQGATLTASGASTYTFNPGGAGTSIVVYPTVNSTYTITGTASGCSNSSAFTQSVSACAGISSLSDKEGWGMNIYPNPTAGKISVEINDGKNFTVFNVIGSEILKGKIEGEKFEINLEKEPSGIYFIRIGSLTRKIIKD